MGDKKQPKKAESLPETSNTKNENKSGKSKTADKIDLLTEDLDITDKLENALVEIFKRYDKDKDNVLNKEELAEFATFSNGHPFSPEEIKEIQEFFDCDDAGNLSKGGFIQMYALQTTSGDEDETWKDLLKHGYNYQL
ncbi:hypothetical protein BB560_005078, partial [Smittium megazygosporum]